MLSAAAAKSSNDQTRRPFRVLTAASRFIPTKSLVIIFLISHASCIASRVDDNTIPADDDYSSRYNLDGLHGLGGDILYRERDARETVASYEARIHTAKLDLWMRGAFALDDKMLSSNADDNDASLLFGHNNLAAVAADIELQAARAPLRHGPVRDVRRRLKRTLVDGCTDEIIGGGDCAGRPSSFMDPLHVGRGGDIGTSTARTEEKLKSLEVNFGVGFSDAIAKNKAEHIADCAKSCEVFYCAKASNATNWDPQAHSSTPFLSYSFGSVPPEDFSEEFRFPLDLVKVSQGKPLFSASESAEVIAAAEEEGVDKNEYKSGKYKLGGDWLVNLPNTRRWFNEKLESVYFPLLHHLFPEVVSSPSVLRAHSVSLLKYNASHPRTDVHVDNGILAMTLAMTPQSEYTGGGTFYEHMGVNAVLQMDVGHATLRPGSVRHGGHRVTSGTRYILGAFLLLEDHVEHVRRLKNRGAELRTSGDLEGAAKHFEWALAINPRCTTCLKDWAELLLSEKQYSLAETKIRRALELLEEQDSDALFTLGLILSEQGKADESISVYKKSVELNADDAELLYNLGIKLGERGDAAGELAMYKKATVVDPKMGGPWINMGTVLAESGNLLDAEVMFMKAMECCPDVKTKAVMNLTLLLQKKANTLASSGNLQGAKDAILEASTMLDEVKPLLDTAMALGGSQEDAMNAKQFRPLRVQCHRFLGQILAGMGDYSACEAEFRTASEKFGDIPGVWEALARILELQGKLDEAKQARDTLASLRGAP